IAAALTGRTADLLPDRTAHKASSARGTSSRTAGGVRPAARAVAAGLTELTADLLSDRTTQEAATRGAFAVDALLAGWAADAVTADRPQRAARPAARSLTEDFAGHAHRRALAVLAGRPGRAHVAARAAVGGVAAEIGADGSARIWTAGGPGRTADNRARLA